MKRKHDFEILATIREYENSVSMPDDERLTYLDPRGGIHLKSGDEAASKHERYAEQCCEYLRFGDEVDLATCNGMNPLDQLKVCDTPQLFLDAGFEQKPMLYTQRHLLDALHPKDEENYHWHGLKIEQVKRLPQLLENPVMLSDNPSRSDALLVVLPEVDCDMLPLIVSVRPDGKGNYSLQEIETNIVLTVFGKDDFEKYFEDVITPDKVIYFNEKQGRKLETLAERPLFRCHPVACDLDGIIIRRPECIVKKESAGKAAYSIDSEARSTRAASVKLVESAPAVHSDVEETRSPEVKK